MGLVGPGTLLNLVLRKPKRILFYSISGYILRPVCFAFHFQFISAFISSLIVFLLVIGYILLYFSIISFWSVCQSDQRSSVRANESLYGCHSFSVMCTWSVFILRLVTWPARSPARSALWFSQNKNKLTNQRKSGKSGNPMGILRGSSQSWAVLSTEAGYTVSPDRAPEDSLVSLWCLLEKKPFSSWFPSIS